MQELQYYCSTCKNGYPLSQWKTYILTDPNIPGGSYTGFNKCPNGHQ